MLKLVPFVLLAGSVCLAGNAANASAIKLKTSADANEIILEAKAASVAEILRLLQHKRLVSMENLSVNQFNRRKSGRWKGTVQFVLSKLLLSQKTSNYIIKRSNPGNGARLRLVFVDSAATRIAALPLQPETNGTLSAQTGAPSEPLTTAKTEQQSETGQTDNSGVVQSQLADFHDGLVVVNDRLRMIGNTFGLSDDDQGMEPVEPNPHDEGQDLRAPPDPSVVANSKSLIGEVAGDARALARGLRSICLSGSCN